MPDAEVLQKELRELRQELAEQKTASAEMEASLNRMRGARTGREEELAAHVSRLERHVEEVEGRNRDVMCMWSETGSVLHAIIAERDEQIMAMRGEASQGEAQVGEAYARVGELEAELAELRERGKVLEGEMRENAERLLSVIKERDESATAVKQLKQQVETSEGRLRALEQNSADVDRDLIESAKRCKEAEDEADRHRATVRMLKDKVSEMEKVEREGGGGEITLRERIKELEMQLDEIMAKGQDQVMGNVGGGKELDMALEELGRAQIALEKAQEEVHVHRREAELLRIQLQSEVTQRVEAQLSLTSPVRDHVAAVSGEAERIRARIGEQEALVGEVRAALESAVGDLEEARERIRVLEVVCGPIGVPGGGCLCPEGLSKYLAGGGSIGAGCSWTMSVAGRGGAAVKKMGEGGAVGALVGHLLDESASPGAIVMSLSALGPFAEGGACSAELVQADVARSLTACMQRHHNVPSALEAGCWLVKLLAEAGPMTLDHLRRGAGGGAVRAVLEAMGGHGDVAALQETGCRAVSALLTNLPPSPSPSSSPDKNSQQPHTARNGRRLQGVVDRGGLESVILAAMGRHPANEGVQREGSCAASAISEAYGGAHCGGPLGASVTEALRNHPSAEGVALAACAAIRHMSWGGGSQGRGEAESGGGLGDLGAVDLVVAAMCRFPHSAAVQRGALWALRCMAHGNEQNKVRMASRMCIDAVVSAVCNHRHDAEAAEQACWVILYVASLDVATSEMIGSRGGVKAIVESLLAHGSHEGVQGQGAWALANLVQGCGTNAGRLMDEGGCAALIGAMKGHMGSLGIQAKACRAMCRLARGDDRACKHIRERGGVDTVMSAMRAHKGSGTVQQEGTDFLKAMANEFMRTMGMDVHNAGPRAAAVDHSIGPVYSLPTSQNATPAPSQHGTPSSTQKGTPSQRAEGGGGGGKRALVYSS